MNSFVFGNCSSDKPLVVIVLGAPGAGKGTQAVYLREKYQLSHIATGDLLRDNLKRNTPIGQKVKTYLDAGTLAPDAIIIEMVLDRLKNPDCKKGYILDGFPRTIGQAETLDCSLQHSNLVVLNIDVTDAVILERLSGRLSCENCGAPYHTIFSQPKIPGKCDKCNGTLIQRKDDKEEVIKERLKIYHLQTKPLIAYYQKQGKLHTIDGTLPKDEISNRFFEVIQKMCKNKS